MASVITRFNNRKTPSELQAYIALNNFKPHHDRIGIRVYRCPQEKHELHVAADWARLFERVRNGKKTKLKSVNGWNVE